HAAPLAHPLDPERAMTPLPLSSRMRIHLACAVLLFTASALPAAAQSRDLDRLLAQVTADVEANRKLTQVIVDKLFSFSELGFHETETKRYLTGILRENGFRVEDGVSG